MKGKVTSIQDTGSCNGRRRHTFVHLLPVAGVNKALSHGSQALSASCSSKLGVQGCWPTCTWLDA